MTPLPMVRRYYLDDFGYLWNGPRPDGEGFRYVRMMGIGDAGSSDLTDDGLGGYDSYAPIWCWETYDPLPDFYEITADVAMKMIDKHRYERRLEDTLKMGGD